MTDPALLPMLYTGGGWFANKVLGPSADAAGGALGQFVTERLQKIFKRAGEKLEPVDPKPLPVGFLYLASQKACFSEDDDLLTDMWASLFVDASEGVDHRHAVFADILSQIGADSAGFLLRLVSSSGEARLPDPGNSLFDDLFYRYRNILNWETKTEEAADAASRSLLDVSIGWPVITRFASHTYPADGKNPAATGTSKVTGENLDLFVIDILSRQKLAAEFDFDFHPGWASPRLAGVYATILGVELVRTCQKPDVHHADQSSGREAV